MKRSRLKNIINKSKSVSNKQEVGNPFDEFKKSLPIEVDDNYRLEAAWKAYGSPKDYKAALWEGLIQPIDENNYKLPSIGYNEETDEYEYLNKGEDNETVAKDIRVWDNDVIPLVQELKLGGYVRTFNKEKDCWTYTKNSQKREQPVEDKGEQVIDSFQVGGKTKLDSKESGEEPIGYLNDGTPLYKKGDGTIGPLTKENIGKDNLFDLIKNSKANWAKRLQDPNRKYITYPDGSIGNFKLAWSEDETGTIVYPEIQEIDGQLVDLSGNPEKAWKSAIEHKDYIYFPSNDAADWFTKNYKKYYRGFDKTPQTFKQGGKSEYKKVKSDKAYYDKDSDTVYYTNDEDLIHEEFHARPDSVLLEQLKPYYENLNDEKIQNFGGNLQFVKRFEGDPGHFYSPEELGARISAAKFRTKGNNYTPEFFKYLRTNENQYGDNMRDLLYMYNDENLSKIFNIGNTQAFKQGGQMNVIPEGALHARKNNMEGAGEDFTAKGIPVMTADGKEQVAEIEKNEIVFNKEVTDFIEENYKKFYSDEVSSSEKDELAIKVGKRLVKEILKNTDDRTGLIEEVADKNNLEYNK